MLKTAGLTDTGRYRSNNEDSYRIEGNALVVADGMGGAAAGEVASGIAADIIMRNIATLTKTTDARTELAVNNAFVDADNEIRRKMHEMPELRGMGTTAVFALPIGRHVLIANVGDSRAYHLSTAQPDRETDTSGSGISDFERKLPQRRFGSIHRVTTDHSVVMELARTGVISEDDIRTHPLRNRITRCLGSCSSGPDILWLDVEENDALLLCSDGLWEMVHEDLMLAICNSAETPEDTCGKLVKAANDGGGVDNITVIAAFFE